MFFWPTVDKAVVVAPWCRCALSMGLVGAYACSCCLARLLLAFLSCVFVKFSLMTLNSIVNLASTYDNQGRWKKARGQEVQVIETIAR